MKAIFPALAGIDKQPAELESEATQGDAKGTGQGFDALLALAAARTAEQGRAVKPLAPGLALQPSAADLATPALTVGVPGVAEEPASARADRALDFAELGAQLSLLSSGQLALPAAQPGPVPAPTSGEQSATTLTTESEPSAFAAAQTLPAMPSALERPPIAQGPFVVPVPQNNPAVDPGGSQPVVPAPERAAEDAVAGPQNVNAQPAAALPATVASAPEVLTDSELSDEAGAQPQLVASAQNAQPAQSITSQPGAETAQAAVRTNAGPSAVRTTTASELSPRAVSASSSTREGEGLRAESGLRARKAERTKASTSEQVEAEPASVPTAAAPSPALTSRLAEQAPVNMPAPPSTASATVAAARAEQGNQGVAAAAAVSSARGQARVLSAPVSSPDSGADVGLAPEPDPGFADLLSADAPPAAASTSQPGTVEQTPGARPAQAAPAMVAPLHVMNDPETGARVVGIEYFSSAADAPAATPSPAPPATAVPVMPAAPDAPQPPEAPAGAEARALSSLDEAPPAAEAPSDTAAETGGREHEAAAQTHRAEARVAFQTTEVQGMRGLDAVVASLLRAGNEAGPGEPAAQARRMTVSAPIGQVRTQKSAATKSAEKVASTLDEAKQDALEREQERSRVNEVAAPEPLPLHTLLDARPPQLDATPEPAPAMPLPTPSAQLMDPDAAAMGKLARGEGVNGASIAIEHPELGPMNVVVQNENGRIDVRATLETPRAAAVLRAHESALRYGIQQAGMTFGALRVRARNGENEPIKTQGSAKRRRGQEWEA